MTMVDRVLDAGVAAGWFAGDEVYGNDPTLRAHLRDRGLGYVVAVARDHQVATGIGVRRAVNLALRPDLRWQRISAGHGAKGHRYYRWTLIELAGTDRDHDIHDGHHALLIRRSRSGDLAFYRTWIPQPVPLATLATVAGRRWTVEESFQTGKGLTGLDAHQVRRWISWRRWTVLAMLAYTLLAVTAAHTTRHQRDPATDPRMPSRLTYNEIRHLFAALLIRPAHDLTHVLDWSHWRRTANARAQASHYTRQQRSLT